MPEPLIHSHITDCLPDDHPLAHTHISCCKCSELLHASNNECMQTWVEWDYGYCIKCFADLPGIEVL